MVLDNISQALGGLGRRLVAAGAAGQNPQAFFNQQLAQEEERKRQQQLQNISNIASGQYIPAFRRAELGSPQAIQQQIRGDLQSALMQNPLTQQAALGQVVSQAFPQPRSPLSQIAKIRADEAAGNLSGEDAQARIDKLTTMQPSTQVTVGQTGERVIEKERAKRLVGLENNIIDAANRASQDLQSLPLLRQSLRASPETGTGAETIQMLTSLGNVLGLDVDTASLAESENFEKLGKELASRNLSLLKGSTSDKDLKFVQSLAAGIGTSKQGNIKFLNGQEALSRKALDVERFLDTLAGEPENVVRREIRRFVLDNPVEDYLRNIEREQLQVRTDNVPMSTVAQPQAQASEGDIIVNQATGQRLILQNGQWRAL